MFGFLKKKEVEKPVEVRHELSSSEKEQLLAEINTLQEKVSKHDTTETVECAHLYEEIGLKQAELGETHKAIEALEQSLLFKQTIGDGYKKLMALYNQKRKEAAQRGDDAGIDYYMGKMDEMRQIAKKVTISRD